MLQPSFNSKKERKEKKERKKRNKEGGGRKKKKKQTYSNYFYHPPYIKWWYLINTALRKVVKMKPRKGTGTSSVKFLFLPATSAGSRAQWDSTERGVRAGSHVTCIRSI
jgi:hypothetical protein